MQNRSNTGDRENPFGSRRFQARAFDWDPNRRIALGPAAMCAASTGRTHDCTRPICTNVKLTLANREPSTHDLSRHSESSRGKSAYDPYKTLETFLRSDVLGGRNPKSIFLSNPNCKRCRAHVQAAVDISGLGSRCSRQFPPIPGEYRPAQPSSLPRAPAPCCRSTAATLLRERGNDEENRL